MVLSKREQFLAIGTIAAVSVVILYWIASYALLDPIDEALQDRTRLQTQLHRDEALIARRRQLTPKWREMVQSGMKNDPAEAESQVLHSIQDWAGEAGVTLSLLKPDRLTDKTRLPVISFQASGTGTMYALTRLLWKIQTARFPVRITEMQISARKEGTDDLSLQLRLTTLYAPAKPAPTTAAVARPNDTGDLP